MANHIANPGVYRALVNQLDKLARHNRQGSYRTRDRYYELVRSGQIRSVKIGRQLRIPKQALIRLSEPHPLSVPAWAVDFLSRPCYTPLCE